MLHGSLKKSEWQHDAQHWLEINRKKKNKYTRGDW